MRPRAAVERVRRIGPRPLLLLRYAGHKAGSTLGRRTLRHAYGRRVARVPGGARLAPPGVSLTPAAALPPPLAEAAERVRAAAEEALAHRATLLGADGARLGREIDWSVDFKSGYRWPSDFYQDVEVTRLGDDSDAKVPWELSRGHQLLALARAAVLYGDRRYVSGLEEQLGSWLDANPPGVGINWTNPMEVAIRAVNWSWTIGTLDHAGLSLDAEVRRDITASLQAHGRHIAASLEGTPYLRSNHYLADVLGLLTLGVGLQGDPAAARWKRRALHAFERQVRRQVLPDGVGFEASLGYHGLALEMFLLARHLARASGAPLSSRFDERLTAMLDASHQLRLPDGRMPQFGDSDSGRILPADPSRPPSQDHLLWLGAAELDHERPLPGAPDPEVAWTFGLDAWRRLAERPARPAEPVAGGRFPDAGLFALRAAGTSVVVRCGDVGQNGNGGHAHNDLLSFELFHGEPLVLDSGTYVYTADPAARNAFRGTAAHNTLMIDEEEINPIDPERLFGLRQLARPRVHGFDSDGAVLRLSASHDGYRRLGCRAIHRRDFELDRDSGALAIRDSIDGRGRCEWTSRVHLAPECRIVSLGAGEADVERGAVRLAIRFFGPVEVEAREGWVSSEYGRRQRAPVLVARGGGDLSASLGCRFEPRRA